MWGSPEKYFFESPYIPTGGERMPIERLSKFVETGQTEEAVAFADQLLDEGVDPHEMIRSLTKTMTYLGDRFAKLEIFLPEIMMAGEAMMAVVDRIRPEMAAEKNMSAKGKIVLGVVKGDLHEIGKNIVKLMLEINGFEVKDLGYDVDSLDFIKTAEAIDAEFIGASSLMTTTMPGQEEIIQFLNDKGIRDKFKVVIGGAPTSQEWGDKIGADLYCPDAKSASEMMVELLWKTSKR
jgi:corrinoid protein of di/trimethylamine methyltransferase